MTKEQIARIRERSHLNCTTCRGRGWLETHCSRCDDSGDDHECKPSPRCPDCVGRGKTASREVMDDELNALCDAAEEAARLREIVASVGAWCETVEGSDEEDAAMLATERLYRKLPKEMLA